MKFLIALSSFLFFLIFQSISVYGGDAGDLVAAAYTGGIAHPPGYPIYSFLGYLVTHIPYSTVAWRASLLSSIPSALSLTILYMFIRDVTGSKFAGFISAATLMFTYIFWLYAIVPEVFALNSLFTVLLLYLAYLYYASGKFRFLLLAAFVSGLSLAHHHIIIFIFPAVGLFLLYRRSDIMKSSLKKKVLLPLAGLLGLAPYVWAVYAAQRVAPIVWSNPDSLQGLIRLFTRAQYGSFQSGITYARLFQSRLLQLPFIFEFYKADFTVPGIVLGIVGIIGLFIRNRKIFWPLITAFIMTGPFFFFYASYLIGSEFKVGTAERFLLPSYIMVAVFIGYGTYTLALIVHTMIRKYSSKLSPRAIISLILILPAMIFYINYPKLSVLRNDLTAERFAVDLLQSTDTNSIFLVKGDTAVFNTQYVYWTMRIRKDVALIHLSKLIDRTLLEHMLTYYPDVYLPDPYSETFVSDFLRVNYFTYPMYSTLPTDGFTPDGFTWIPMGLVYKLYADDAIPPYETYKSMNQSLWNRYADPLSGSLGQYKNLMLSNVADYYRDARLRSGLYSANRGEDLETARMHFIEAIRLDPDFEDAYYLLGDTLIELGECDTAVRTLQEGFDRQIQPDEIIFSHAMKKAYAECFKNDEKAAEWNEKLESLQKEETLRLEEL